MIRIVNKVNKNKKEIIIIQGSIIEMVDKAKEEISHIIPKEYPISAILEAINNAVLYRDYLAYNKNIEVVIADKNISIFSPCSLINSNVNKESNRKKRNMWLYEKLITLDKDNKRFLNNGGGFYRMKNSFKSIGKVKMINSIKEDYFKVVFPGISAFKSSEN